MSMQVKTLIREAIESDLCRMSMARWIAHCVSGLSSLPCSVSTGDIAAMVERPPDSSLGDFALPCFRFAKECKKKPEDLAAEMVRLFVPSASDDVATVFYWVERVENKGAFLNFTIKNQALSRFFLPRVLNEDSAFFSELRKSNERHKTRVMIEHSQPNTHKEFHVGHARNVCLGDSLVRIFRYCGYSVISTNYPGDEGTHIAKCLWYIRTFNKKSPESDRGAWLGQMYVESVRTLSELAGEEKLKADQEVSGILGAIEERKGEVFEQWKSTREWSLQSFYEIYDWLGVKFDHYFFESELSEASQKIVDEYYQKGTFILSKEAIGIDLEQYKLGFLLLRKRDGNTLYATKDLALAQRKFKEFAVDRSIYVVAHEQNLHFKQVFKTLELMGFEQASQCFHLSYGMVVLPDGKMSSREGNSYSFAQLSQAVSSAIRDFMKTNDSDWDEREIDDTVRRLSAGAIRYGMVGSDPVKNVVFKLDDWVSFDGDSGPYLMYSYARTKSIIRKAVATEVVNSESTKSWQMTNVHYYLLSDIEEKQLMLHLYDFHRVVVQACEQYKPSLIAHFLHQGCQNFNRSYAKLSVLRAESRELRIARLGLMMAFSKILFQGLELLGIQPPERM